MDLHRKKWQVAVVFDARRMTGDCPNPDAYDEQINVWYEMALNDANEEIQHHAADSLFGFYLRKKNYPMAENISTILLDGGNEIYFNIAPLWDGEDDLFSLNEISEKELSQFTNLKSVAIMTSDYEEMKAVLEKHGIQVKEI